MTSHGKGEERPVPVCITSNDEGCMKKFDKGGGVTKMPKNSMSFMDNPFSTLLV